MRTRQLVPGLLVALVVALACPSAFATPIALVNADFEAGTLAGWSTFVTSNGVLNPRVTSFDVDGDAVASLAATFTVGQSLFVSGQQEGGGIFQNFVSVLGSIAVDVDIASFHPSTQLNAAGGLFGLLIDGVVVDSFDFSSILAGGTERGTLSAVVPVSAGAHEIRLLMTRPFQQGIGGTPNQYVDNVRIDQVTAVPEPTSLTLLGAALAGLAARRRRSRKQATSVN